MMDDMTREYLGTLHKPGPSLPIPNDDPRCRCQLSPDGVPEGATVMTGWSGIPGTPEATLALYADCPYHGGTVRAFTESSLSGFSLGTT